MFQKHSLSLLLLLFVAFQPAQAKESKAEPFKRGVVVSQCERCSEWGAEILRRGGNAFDAAVATALALAVLEPNGSGLGGGGFALFMEQERGGLRVLDFRERAPARVIEMGANSRNGAQAAGVPGELAGLNFLIENYGTKRFKELSSRPTFWALKGAQVSPALARSIKARQETLRQYPSSAEIFLKADGQPKEEGDIFTQPSLAETLRTIGERGIEDFYSGRVAGALAMDLEGASGLIDLIDLLDYQVRELEPLCGPYEKSEMMVCSVPLPSSGGIAMLESLKAYELLKADQTKASESNFPKLIRAMQIAFEDRAEFLGDPLFSEIDVPKLLSEDYLQKRLNENPKQKPESQEGKQTTHFTAADKWGNVVAITVSLNQGLGSGYVLPSTGILLNNTLDDFAQPGAKNLYGMTGNKLNFPEAGKTPLSSMTPTFIMDKDFRPIYSLGSPGGPTIISAVLNTTLNLLEKELSLEDAVKAPRFHYQASPNLIYSEPGFLSQSEKESYSLKSGLVFALEKDNAAWGSFYPWAVEAIGLDWEAGKLSGVSDPRKELGVVYE